MYFDLEFITLYPYTYMHAWGIEWHVVVQGDFQDYFECVVDRPIYSHYTCIFSVENLDLHIATNLNKLTHSPKTLHPDNTVGLMRPDNSAILVHKCKCLHQICVRIRLIHQGDGNLFWTFSENRQHECVCANCSILNSLKHKCLSLKKGSWDHF